MYSKRIAFSLLACFFAGCASFKTTALYRFDNDSVVPECNNEKLKGLPVKLKVPSHVRVTIYEQQVILATSDADVATKKGKAVTSAATVRETQGQIAKLSTDVTDAVTRSNDATNELTRRTAQVVAAKMEPAGPDRDAKVSVAEALEKAAKEEKVEAELQLTAAIKRKNEDLSKLLDKLGNDKKTAALDADEAVIKYKLVSFTPQQLVVETELEYTAKIFLVDFRRPAAGILNLNEASMDDEQYFSKIQADVTERTLEDVGKALDTLKGTVTPPKLPAAATTNADTPPGAGNGDVNFQRSIVASKRFDISEPDWEARMNSFIDAKLNSQNGSFASDDELETQVPVAALQTDE